MSKNRLSEPKTIRELRQWAVDRIDELAPYDSSAPLGPYLQAWKTAYRLAARFGASRKVLKALAPPAGGWTFAGFVVGMIRVQVPTRLARLVAWCDRQLEARARLTSQHERADAALPTAGAGSAAQRASLAIIRMQRRGRGIGAKVIVARLRRQGIQITEGTFRRNVVPWLNNNRVQNERARGGYYLP
jgi:hypothetical protein